ncbi:peptidoglycan bridge formation glycyltransferase FemA/FemB family protein [Patescibacteria group bacterium]|nr:peptidoglycan bridge formation glycyltransferase FemA/FemB family protein [Patescibacteria group bacterium]
MTIRQVDEKDREKFNKAAVHPLQSWEWGQFREKAGNKIVRFGVFSGNTLKEALTIIFSKIPYSNLKIGTLIKGPKPTKEILEALKKLAKDENAVFIKSEPNILKDQKTIKLLDSSGCVKGKRLFTPTTFWVDLTKSEEELLASFHPKTRYNIRLAQKQGVEIVEDNSQNAFEKYWQLTRETTLRQGFYAHTEKYHRLMWEILHPAGIAHLLVAKYKGEIITTWIVFVWHDFLYYPYGASTDKYKNVMANNLIMWEAIRFGKKLGLKTFDLWGREPGKGFTKFKEGYNPKIVEFLGTWDLVTSPFYYLYRLTESIRWLLLRLKSRLVKPTF